MTQDFPERKQMANRRRTNITFASNAANCLQTRRPEAHMDFTSVLLTRACQDHPTTPACPELGGKPSRTLPGTEPTPNMALSLPATPTIFQRRCLRCLLSLLTSLFSGQRVRAHSGFWPEPQRADHPGRMMGALWQKHALCFCHISGHDAPGSGSPQREKVWAGSNMS
jgi:hypothetical protein